MTLFNRHFQQAVRDIPGDLPSPPPLPSPLCSSLAGCHWLNFVDSLLSVSEGPDGKVQLRESWKLDGTHLSPAYVSLVETAFRNLFAA